MSTRKQHIGKRDKKGMEKGDQNKTFFWRVKDKKGYQYGTLQAPTISAVRTQLIRQGHPAAQIRQRPFVKTKSYRIKPLEITRWIRQLATMISSGLPLLEALSVSIVSSPKGDLPALTQQVKSHIEKGLSFSDSLKKHPNHFPPLLCNMVAAGEASGTLDTMLERVAEYYEKTAALKQRIKKALTYPIAVLIIALAVIILMLVFVIPQFERMFASFDAQLPLFTQWVIHASAVLRAQGIPVALFLCCISIVLYSLYKRSPAWQKRLDRWRLKLPVFGPLFAKSAFSRFARTLATTVFAGMPLLDALHLAAQVTGNLYFKHNLLQLRTHIEKGYAFGQAMPTLGCFDPMAVQMIAIGEQSGKLPEMLNKVADIYDADIDTLVDSLSSLMEPFIMVLLGLVVGGLVLAMYLPVFQLGSVV